MKTASHGRNGVEEHLDHGLEGKEKCAPGNATTLCQQKTRRTERGLRVLGCKLNQVKSYPIFIFMLNHDQITILYKRYRYREPRPRALRLPYQIMISVLWCKIKLCLKIVYRHKVMNYSMCTGIVIILYLVGTNGCEWVSMGAVRSRAQTHERNKVKRVKKMDK